MFTVILIGAGCFVAGVIATVVVIGLCFAASGWSIAM